MLDRIKKPTVDDTSDRIYKLINKEVLDIHDIVKMKKELKCLALLWFREGRFNDQI